MKRLRAACFALLAVLIFTGCAAPVPTAEKREVAVAAPAPPAPPAGERMTAPRQVEDHDLFLEGSALLNPPGGPDLEKAREVFVALLEHYPQSRWRLAAEGFIHLIDESRASREAGRDVRLGQEKLRAEISAVLQENESLKKNLRELKERVQTETAALIQENEKLKTDLRRLKALEIELEKRERMLR